MWGHTHTVFCCFVCFCPISCAPCTSPQFQIDTWSFPGSESYSGRSDALRRLCLEFLYVCIFVVATHFYSRCPGSVERQNSAEVTKRASGTQSAPHPSSPANMLLTPQPTSCSFTSPLLPLLRCPGKGTDRGQNLNKERTLRYIETTSPGLLGSY